LNFVRIKLLEIVGDKFFFYPNIYCKGCKSRILDFFGIVGDALSPKIKEKRPKKQIHLFRQADRQWAGGFGFMKCLVPHFIPDSVFWDSYFKIIILLVMG
jgi:hypothetical protein